MAAQKQKKRMLIPTERLFFWAKRDRAREQSFFRARREGWRDLIPPVDDETAPRYRFRRMAAQRKQPARPIWTPWLWVK